MYFVHKTMTKIELSPLLFHRKRATTGNEGEGAPIQVAFPSGLAGIAMPVRKHSSSQAVIDPLAFDFTAVGSSPDASIFGGADNNNFVRFGGQFLSNSGLRKSRLVLAFVVACLINLVVTILLFSHADVAELSNVIIPDVTDSSVVPIAFQEVGSERRTDETLFFIFNVLSLIIATVGALFSSCLALWIYKMVTLIGLVLGISAFPTTVYATRFVIDAIMLIMAQRLQKHFGPSVLPLGHR